MYVVETYHMNMTEVEKGSNLQVLILTPNMSRGIKRRRNYIFRVCEGEVRRKVRILTDAV